MSVWQDMRFAVRMLSTERWFSLAAILALGLGIGATNTFFTLVNAAVLRGLPIEAPDRVIAIGFRDALNRPVDLTRAELDDVREAARTLNGVAAYTSSPIAIGGPQRTPERITGTYVSANAFAVMGTPPALGRAFLPADDRAGAPAVIAISDRLWQTRYSADPAILGRAVTIDGAPATIVGVMPAGLRFPNNSDVWQPLARIGDVLPAQRDARSLVVFGRLTGGATGADAAAEMTLLAERWAQQSPTVYQGLRIATDPMHDRFMGRITDRVWIAFLIVGIALVIIACANVANLLLMRGVRRTREVVIRTALGATRLRIVRQMLVESAVLAAAAGVVGLGLSLAGLQLIKATLPVDGLPYWFVLDMDARVLMTLVGICVASVVLFGLAPAAHAASVHVGDGRTRARRATAVFLAAEFALTLVLLAAVGAGVRDSTVDTAPIDGSRILTAWITLPAGPSRTKATRDAFFDELQRRLRGANGVADATVATALPETGGAQQPLTIAGRATDGAAAPAMVTAVAVGETYFETLATSLVRGRPFTASDGSEGNDTVIINQRLADLYFPNQNPIGQLIRAGTQPGAPPDAWSRIVGVAPTVRQRLLGFDPDPVVYRPYRALNTRTMAVLVRTTAAPATIVDVLRGHVSELAPDLPLYRVMTLDDAIDAAQWNNRFSAQLLNSVAGIALLLALVGLYAVTAHAVLQRRHELGIRLALGARPFQISWLVLRRALWQLGLGLAVGIGGAIAFDRVFSDPTIPVRITDAVTLVPVLGLVIVVAIAACLLPARRAARTHPAVVLRAE